MPGSPYTGLAAGESGKAYGPDEATKPAELIPVCPQCWSLDVWFRSGTTGRALPSILLPGGDVNQPGAGRPGLGDHARPRESRQPGATSYKLPRLIVTAP